MKPVAADIRQALIDLGGKATLSDIYEKCPRWSQSYIRQQIQSHSNDTKTTPKFENLFKTVNGLGNGVWGLREYKIGEEHFNNNLEENEVEYRTDQAKRHLTTFNRIIRDTVLANEIKKLLDYECQLCCLKIKLPNEQFYIEAHHIKPLGTPYNGPDTQDNILIVCPNCHVKCDYRLIKLAIEEINNNKQKINPEYIRFHNEEYKVKISVG